MFAATAGRKGAAAAATPLAALLARRSAATGPGTEAPATPASSTGVDRVLKGIPDWSRPIIAALAVLAVFFWVRSLLANARRRHLERQGRRMAVDLSSLQAALVPDVPARVGALEASVAYRPADGPAAGGDFYDTFELTDGRIAILVGDASGHGREAITRATSLRYTLRAYLELGGPPRHALALAGRALSNDSAQAEFATAVVALHDRAAGTLTYACAGHPPPVVVGPDEHEAVTACSSPAIGWGMPTGQRETMLALRPGSVACFYTDGLVEARHEGEMLGRDRLAEVVRGLPPEGGAADVLAQMRSMADDATDDMAALVVRPDAAAGPEQPLRIEELEVGAADVDDGTAAAFLAACGFDMERILHTLAEVRSRLNDVPALVLSVRMQPLSVQAAPPDTLPGLPAADVRVAAAART